MITVGNYVFLSTIEFDLSFIFCSSLPKTHKWKGSRQHNQPDPHSQKLPALPHQMFQGMCVTWHNRMLTVDNALCRVAHHWHEKLYYLHFSNELDLSHLVLVVAPFYAWNDNSASTHLKIWGIHEINIIYVFNLIFSFVELWFSTHTC